ncbi:MAG: hypothetical protein P1T08_15095 [Acidimicrobiia bacterium]|nr:hypothetical protein [Acidimicrobiia bacterium]
MTEKLDFSGFSAAPGREPAPRLPRAEQKRTVRKPAAPKVARRKRRVNVSLDPGISRWAVAAAEHRGLTLSDLLRVAYREHSQRVDASWFAGDPVPFAHRSPTSNGRMIHMFYLTDAEVRILDELAAAHGSSRSAVAAALLKLLKSN